MHYSYNEPFYQKNIHPYWVSILPNQSKPLEVISQQNVTSYYSMPPDKPPSFDYPLYSNTLETNKPINEFEYKQVAQQRKVETSYVSVQKILKMRK